LKLDTCAPPGIILNIILYNMTSLLELLGRLSLALHRCEIGVGSEKDVFDVILEVRALVSSKNLQICQALCDPDIVKVLSGIDANLIIRIMRELRSATPSMPRAILTPTHTQPMERTGTAKRKFRTVVVPFDMPPLRLE
jgi:hypothetical protein